MSFFPAVQLWHKDLDFKRPPYSLMPSNRMSIIWVNSDGCKVYKATYPDRLDLFQVD